MGTSRVSIRSSDLNDGKISIKNIKQNVKGIRVSKVNITNNIYTVISGVNDLLHITDSTDREKTITAGIYNEDTLRAEIESKLQDINSNYSVTYDSSTNTYTLAYTSAFSINAQSTCLTLIGFSGAQSADTTHISDQVVQLGYLNNELFVSSHTLSGKNFYQFGNTHDKYILCKIPNPSSGSTIFYDNEKSWPEIEYSDSKNVTEIDLKLLLSNGEEIDNHGGIWTVEIMFFY